MSTLHPVAPFGLGQGVICTDRRYCAAGRAWKSGAGDNSSTLETDSREQEVARDSGKLQSEQPHNMKNIFFWRTFSPLFHSPTHFSLLLH